jgi:hypothetical protein
MWLLTFWPHPMPFFFAYVSVTWSFCSRTFQSMLILTSGITVPSAWKTLPCSCQGTSLSLTNLHSNLSLGKPSHKSFTVYCPLCGTCLLLTSSVCSLPSHLPPLSGCDFRPCLTILAPGRTPSTEQVLTVCWTDEWTDGWTAQFYSLESPLNKRVRKTFCAIVIKEAMANGTPNFFLNIQFFPFIRIYSL